MAAKTLIVQNMELLVKDMVLKVVGVISFGIAVVFASTNYARATTYYLFEDGYRFANGSGADLGHSRIYGYIFFAKKADLQLTEVQRASRGQIYEAILFGGATGNQILYERVFDPRENVSDWDENDLDVPIELVKGDQYAILLSGQAGTHCRISFSDNNFAKLEENTAVIDGIITEDYRFISADDFEIDEANDLYGTFIDKAVSVSDTGIIFGGGHGSIAVSAPATYIFDRLIMGVLELQRKQ